MEIGDLSLATDIAKALDNSSRHLLGLRGPDGVWQGRLSSSALATAVAAFALGRASPQALTPAATRGLDWLLAHLNADGGWGDTPDSPSNLSTTLLGWSALSLLPAEDARRKTAESKVEAWLARRAGGCEPERIVGAVLRHYGNDRTFSVPILTLCALAGRLGRAPDCWAAVPQLPFELAALPRGLFRWIGLPVVSYALPALIAMGLARHALGPRAGRAAAALRHALTGRVLRVLDGLQPADGGFLEAVPLTGFVVMALAAVGHGQSQVVKRGVAFLERAARDDGSWPIDANLSTWLTTLSIRALASSGTLGERLAPAECLELGAWLLGLQLQVRHPFTLAAPGGWAWTDLPGGVPDADDTAGALLALADLADAGPGRMAYEAAAERGLRWLLGLRNSDGGMPTFCRGWGRLPFDRSCPEITAHAMRAFDRWYDDVAPRLRPRLDEALHEGFAYLARTQAPDGWWRPLWFGNQHVEGHANAVYGTAVVLRALVNITPERLPPSVENVRRARAWLAGVQNTDGGWGGSRGAPSSIEETAVALGALAGGGSEEAVVRGVRWLLERTSGGRAFEPAPVGLYFASLWYAEQVYPVVFAVEAFARVLGASPGSQPARETSVYSNRKAAKIASGSTRNRDTPS